MYDQEYTEYQLKKRSFIRSFIRNIFLKNTLKYVKGRAIDFGCGVGELLALLSSGSLGFDVNETTVRYCKKKNLNAELYEPEIDKYQFRECEAGKYTTFIMSHLLEHLEDPLESIRTIMQSCARLEVERIIIIVPGKKGFANDKTHRTFIDYRFFKDNNLFGYEEFMINLVRYYPVNLRMFGNIFTYNEMNIVFDRRK